MAIIYFSNVRCSFPNLAEPFKSVKFPTSAPMFSIDIIDMLLDNHQVKEFMQTYAAMAATTWKEHANQVMQMIQSDKRARCFGMGPEKVNETTFKPLDGYGQGVWINAKSKNRPQIIRPDGKPASNDMEALELARKIYGGCRVNVALQPWLRTTNKGISCDLIAVQFAADDTSFGASSPDVSGMFGATQAAPAAAVPGFAATVPTMPAPPMFGAAPPAFAAPKMPWQ